MSFAKRVVRLRKKSGYNRVPLSFRKGKSQQSLSIVESVQDVNDVVLDDSCDDPNILAFALLNSRSQAEERNYKMWRPRASGLHDGCIRADVLMCVKKKTRKEYSNPQMRVTYGIGSALHFWCQNTDYVFGNNRIGWWKCLACGEVRYFGTPPVSQCSCGASEKASIYYEHGLSIEKYYVGGHPDLFIFVLNVDGEKFLRVVEIKSISGKGFEELKHPLAAHETQVNVYMWFASEDKTLPLKVDPSIGYVLYISKRHVSKKLPFKLFPVKRNEKLIERVSKLLDDFKIGIKEYPKYLPEKHPECKRNFSCYRANWCDVRAECKKHR